MQKISSHLFMFSFMIALIAIFAFSGCQKSSTTSPSPMQMSETATQDAVAAISVTTAEGNGGSMDMMGDAFTCASGLKISANIFGLGGWFGRRFDGGTVDSSYDSTTGWWTLHVVRDRGDTTSEDSNGGHYYTHFERTYQVQYLNTQNNFQKYWRVSNGNSTDTAYSVHFKVISGSGYVKTPKISDYLTSISADWVLTGTNTPVITLNGTKTRSGIDTVSRGNSVRTLNYTWTATFTNVVGPRGTRLNMAAKTSGTISGTFTGTASFQKGETYSERTINRTFTITLGSGNSGVRMNNHLYHSDFVDGTTEDF